MGKPVVFRMDVVEARTDDTRPAPFGWSGTRAELEESMREAERVYDLVLRRKRAALQAREDAEAKRREQERADAERKRKAERKAFVDEWFRRNVRDFTSPPVREFERLELQCFEPRILGYDK